MKTRNVLECGGPPPLFPTIAWVCPAKSPSGLAHSKAWWPILAFIILHSAFCLRAWGDFSIDWSTIDAGGGTSTGGVYTVTGTIGQPDAGTLTGGNYTLTGGFWSILAAIQTPGAPLLTITLNSQLSTVTVS